MTGGEAALLMEDLREAIEEHAGERVVMECWRAARAQVQELEEEVAALRLEAITLRAASDHQQ